jgi:general secretion pathway protein M
MSGFDRDKHLRPLLLCALGLLLLVLVWACTGYQQALDRLERQTRGAITELVEFEAALSDYRQLEAQLKSRQVAGGDQSEVSLISTVETATQQIGARSQLIYVRPQPDKVRDGLIEEGVEIKLEKLKLSQLVELLYQFEKSQGRMRIAQLRSRTRFESPDLLDAVMILSRLKEGRS